ncbi:MAG: hypothetical protein JNN13_17565 [Planctomycetes bacterium]|nr:hypothetical protein [Planctomycetota bacterium]MCC7399271.1 hypothetical protein [Planctomycetota bacterium]
MLAVTFLRLDAQQIVATIGRLEARIRERFPAASLAGVAGDLLATARAHAARTRSIRRPDWRLRLLSTLLLGGGIACLGLVFVTMRPRDEVEWRLADAVQTFEAGLSMLFFLGAGAVYVASLELRQKRRRCREALHELRAMAHIVDMHQLTKDPDRALHAGADTAASPRRSLSRFELVRYLDYCSEMLSLMGKVAALYAQDFPDAEAVAAVDDIEDLTTGLSRKIWQKIMILSQDAAAPGLDADATGTRFPA